MTQRSTSPYGTTNRYGIEYLPGKLEVDGNSRTPDRYNVYVINTGEDVRKNLATRQDAEAEIDRLETRPATTPAPPATTQPAAGRQPGWSSASRRFRGRGGHPLGEVTGRGDGYTEYKDTAFGTRGRVQIWDES